MTILVTNGDSFTYGAELKDDFPSHSRFAWPSLVAHKIHAELINDAISSSSNSSITRRTINRVTSLLRKNPPSDLLVVVMWSFPQRYEVRLNYDSRTPQTPWYDVSPWDSYTSIDEVLGNFLNKTSNRAIIDSHKDHIKFLKRSGLGSYIKEFNINIGSEFWEIYTSLKEMHYLQSFLEANSVEYVFTACSSDFLTTSVFNSSDETIESLKSMIKFDRWCLFDNLGFVEWAKHNNFPFGTTHPLEDAHIAAADILCNFLQENYID